MNWQDYVIIFLWIFVLAFFVIAIFKRPIDREAFVALPSPTTLSQQPTLTLYWTSWCPFAKKVMQVWDSVTQAYLGTQLNVTSVDGDEFPEIVKAANVVSFPTIVFTKDGNATEYLGEKKLSAISRFIELS